MTADRISQLTPSARAELEEQKEVAKKIFNTAQAAAGETKTDREEDVSMSGNKFGGGEV